MFIYLRIPIFKGQPKVDYLESIVDCIKAKLVAWKLFIRSIANTKTKKPASLRGDKSDANRQ